MAYLSGWDQDNRIEFSSNPSKVESQLSTFPGLLRICDASGNADDDLTAVFDELAITVTGDAFTRSDSNDAWFDNTYWAGSAGGLFGVWSTDHWETSGTFAYTIQLDPVGGWGAGFTGSVMQITLDNITGGSGTFTFKLDSQSGQDVEVTGISMSDTDTYDFDISAFTGDIVNFRILDEAGGTVPFDCTAINFYTPDDMPDSSLWEVVENTDGNLEKLSGGTLNFNSDGTGDDEIWIRTPYLISGNFDIQVDFSPTTIDKPTVAAHYGGRLIISNTKEIDDEYCHISFIRNNTGGGGYDLIADGSTTTADTASESLMDTKFRFVRSGSVISVYYHNGSSWEFDGAGSKTMSETFTDDVYIHLWSQCLNGENMNVDYDNFVITSGTVKWPVGAHPNRKKIAITSSDGTTELYAEIALWDSENEVANIWFRAISISATVAQTFYLYYDSTHKNNDTKIGDTGESLVLSVWSNNYRVALHMAQDPTTPFQPRELHASTAVQDQGSPNIDCNYTFTAVDCTGLTKANGQLFVFIRCSNWSLVTSCKISLTSSAGLGTEEWYLDKTAIEALYPSGIQSSIEPMLFPLAGCTTTGGELDVTEIDHLSFSAVVTGTVWLFWRSASILPIDLPVLDSVEGNHAVGFGGMDLTNLIDTPYGKGYSLDGAGENISLDTWCNAMEAVNYGTVELVFQGNVAANGTLFSFSEPMESNTDGRLVRKSDGDIEAAVRDEGTYDLQMDAEVDVSDADWHVVQWVMGTNFNSLFIDGIEVTGDYTVGSSSSAAWLSDLDTTDGNITSMRIGANRDSSGPAGITLFTGKVSEFLYSQTARNDGWAKASYNNLIDNLFNYGGDPPAEGGGGMFGQLRHSAIFGGLIAR